MSPSSTQIDQVGAVWPPLDYAAWRETVATLQLWIQVIGKIRLAKTPWLNHSWHVVLYVSARGLATSPIPFGFEQVEIEFDFIDHVLDIRTTQGDKRQIRLVPQTVGNFYRKVMTTLEELGFPVSIDVVPNEIENPIPFPEDDIHATYDPEAVFRFWRALSQIDRVFKEFRTGFIGKASPVHFFWGSFDLAVTRFSGRRAPLHPGGIPNLADDVVREAYSHEVSSVGFWPGSDAFPRPAFYSYAYPEPPGYRDQPVEPAQAVFDTTLSEFILPYEAIRTARQPDDVLMAFLQSTYAAAARTADWDPHLTCAKGKAGQPRPVAG